MGKFTLTIDMDNAAFEDDPAIEVADELRRIADLVTQGFTFGQAVDSNGNSVGSWSL